MNTKTLLSRKASVADGPAPWLFGIVVLLMLMSSPDAAFPQSTGKREETCHPPSFPAMTYDEDNRFLSNPDCRTEFFDRLKFIPLRGSNENYYLSFGVSIRDRYIGRHAAYKRRWKSTGTPHSSPSICISLRAIFCGRQPPRKISTIGPVGLNSGTEH